MIMFSSNALVEDISHPTIMLVHLFLLNYSSSSKNSSNCISLKPSIAPSCPYISVIFFLSFLYFALLLPVVKGTYHFSLPPQDEDVDSKPICMVMIS
jgi:hypothetical protein